MIIFIHLNIIIALKKQKYEILLHSEKVYLNLTNIDT